MAVASLKIPSENSTACNVGYFYGLIKELAAIVSVAQNTADSIKTYFVYKRPTHLLTKYKRKEIMIKAMIVAIIPK